jgi:hypothetical protein
MSTNDPRNTTTYTGIGGDSCSQQLNNTPFSLDGLGQQPSTIIIKNTAANAYHHCVVPNGGSLYTATGNVLTTNTISTNAWVKQDISAHGIHINGDAKIIGDAEIEGDLTIKGESITQLLEEIKDRLVILRPNADLESRWDQLRELRQQYMEMEKDILEKEEILRILKE